ncbi:MAG: ABC transporter ATP-binding protein [Acidobacteria bacterium]|nr:ABC transporter ATP-binding protein [Acidobacteriota bacterium]
MALIQVQSVSVAYGSPAKPVLNNIGLDIEAGEFICLLGRTGCGKSTLLRLILGSETPASGVVTVKGSPRQRPDPVCGYVPQKYSLFPDRTVLDNITFGPEVSEFNLLTRWSPRFYSRRREFRKEALQLMQRLGLRESDAGKYPDQLSGGMQQRVAIAQAFINKPRILLMDEAFSALDPGTRQGMQRLMKQLWRDTGITVVFVTHNTKEALALATRVVVLAKPAPDQGAGILMQFPVAQPCAEAEIGELTTRLESVFGGSEDLEDSLVPTA